MIPGLVKGLATTARSMTRRHHTVEYPDVKPQLPPRSRGVIALTEENCTSCMLCARECPDWCIYIDSHKEEIPASTPGGRARQRNVLDRFAIDFSLCMYCGICIEVCPFDALHWSPEFEYSELDIRDLLHEKDRLGEWMATVPPPPALDPGSPDPAELVALNRPARPAAPAAPASRATTVRRAAPGPAEPGAAPVAQPVSPQPRAPSADEPAPTDESRTRVMPAVAPPEAPGLPASPPTVQLPAQRPSGEEQ
jgi:NADH-quinone oxidoreductase subunit I